MFPPIPKTGVCWKTWTHKSITFLTGKQLLNKQTAVVTGRFPFISLDGRRVLTLDSQCHHWWKVLRRCILAFKPETIHFNSPKTYFYPYTVHSKDFFGKGNSLRLNWHFMQLVASCIFKHFQLAVLLEKSTDYKSSQRETHTVVSFTAQAALPLAAVIWSARQQFKRISLSK